jgi:hypothetical protein
MTRMTFCMTSYIAATLETNFIEGWLKAESRHDHLPDPTTVSDHRIRICVLYQAPYQVVDASELLRIRIFTIVIIKALYHHCTFDDRTKIDKTWDGPYHNGVSRSRIITRPHMRS